MSLCHYSASGHSDVWVLIYGSRAVPFMLAVSLGQGREEEATDRLKQLIRRVSVCCLFPKCVRVRVRVRAFICECVHVCLPLCLSTSLSMSFLFVCCVCLCVCLYVCLFESVCVCVRVCALCTLKYMYL